MRTGSESSTSTVTSFTFSKPPGEDCEDGGEASVRQKRKGFFHDTVSLDSMSVSSMSEFSECPTTGTDDTPEQRLYSPVAEIESESLLEPVDYYDGHPVREGKEAVFDSGPPLLVGSCVTVDSGINIPGSMPGSAFESMAFSAGEQPPPPFPLPDASCSVASGCSTNGVPKPDQNGLETAEEPDFERSFELDEDPVLEQKRRKQKLYGSWYRKKSSVLVLESDSEDNMGADCGAEDSSLDLDDGTESVPAGYSQVEILGSHEEPPPAYLPPPPVHATELHAPDVAGGDSRAGRADTITNSDAQTTGSVLAEMGSVPALLHGRPTADTSLQTGADSLRTRDCVGGVPAGYSKIEILGSVEKPPSPVHAAVLHTSDVAGGDSRANRADTITNENVQASADSSPALPRSRPLTAADSNAAPSSGGDATNTPPGSAADLLDPSDTGDPEPAWPGYANIETQGEPRIPKPAMKMRSFSSPRIKKKPKPLPREFQRKLRSQGNLNDPNSSSRETKFLSSLPATLKPTPAPRSNTGSQECVPQQRTEEVNGEGLDLSSSLPTDFLLTSAAQNMDSSPIAAVQDSRDHAGITTKPKSVSSPPNPLPKLAPVPPPRTKRKGKFRKTSSGSSSSNSASSLSNLPGKESPSHETSDDVIPILRSDAMESPDGTSSQFVAAQERNHTGLSHDRSRDSPEANHPVSPDLPKESRDSSEGGSPELPEGPSSERPSPVPEDPFHRNHLWQSVPELSLLDLPGERGEWEETRLSKVSMEVNR